MTSRVSIPLMICIAVAAVAVLGLFRSAPGGDGGYGSSASAADEVAASVAIDEAGQADDPNAPGPQPATLQIADFAFESNLVVSAGQTVIVSNVDGAPHTVTATDASFDTGSIAGGATGSFVAPNAPGTHSFFCALHPSMTATLTVAP